MWYILAINLRRRHHKSVWNKTMLTQWGYIWWAMCYCLRKRRERCHLLTKWRTAYKRYISWWGHHLPLKNLSTIGKMDSTCTRKDCSCKKQKKSKLTRESNLDLSHSRSVTSLANDKGDSSRSFLLPFLLPSWRAMRSYRPHLQVRDPIWWDDWTHSLHRRSPSWGFPEFFSAVR